MKTMVSLFPCMLFSVFPIKSENTVYSDTTISARLTQYYIGNPVEKLYAHQDRSFYHAGETMWMKIYQSMQSENKPISKVVYTDLINGDGQIIISTKWPLTQGIASGNIELPTNMSTGKYQIRCYTRWMQNFDANGFFTREVTIYGYPTPLPEKETSSSKVHLHFFPESGNLINSLPSKVAFQVTNAYGKGLSANGKLSALLKKMN